MSAMTSSHPSVHRAAVIRRRLDQHGADPRHRVRIAFFGDHAVLDGEVDRFADKEAVLSATLLLGEVRVVTDRVTVRTSPEFGG